MASDDDDTVSPPPPVSHSEGTSYAVAFGDPSQHPVPDDIKLSSLCFNLSSRERKRLRPIRRMPHIISRELMKKKVALERLSVDSGVESELSAEAEIGAFVFMTESDDLWRVVVSFL